MLYTRNQYNVVKQLYLNKENINTSACMICVNMPLAKASLMAKLKDDGWVVYFVYSAGRHWKVTWQRHQYINLIISHEELRTMV